MRRETHERYSGGQHPTALMAKLRSAPRGRLGELEFAAGRRLVLSFVAMVRTLYLAAEVGDV